VRPGAAAVDSNDFLLASCALARHSAATKIEAPRPTVMISAPISAVRARLGSGIIS
jgi:hypothetical protein